MKYMALKVDGQDWPGSLIKAQAEMDRLNKDVQFVQQCWTIHSWQLTPTGCCFLLVSPH